MIRLIMEKELRDTLGSTKFASSFGVCAILIVLAFLAGVKTYHVRLARHEAAKAENLRKMEGLTDWLRVNSHRIFLPPRPLEALVGGVSSDIGRTIEMRGRGELFPYDSPYGSDPLFAVFRSLDLEFVFQVVLSLFAILFAFDAVNGEKEQGTLRLTFANAVPRDGYIFGKILGSVTALVVPLVLPILIGFLILLLGGVPLTGAEWLRLVLIVMVGFGYCTAFLILSVLISTLTKRSSSSFLFSLVIWILFVLVIPRASVLLAGRAVPVPSVDELAYKKGQLRSQLWGEDMDRMATFKPSETTDPEGMMDEFNRYMEDLTKKREDKMKAFSDGLNEERRNRQAVQERAAFGLARISPSAAFSLAATRLAGSSLALKGHFVEEALAYQQEFGEFMVEKTGMNPGGKIIMIKMKNGDEEEKPIDPNELPPFRYKPESVRHALQSAAPDMGLLALFNIVFFAGAWAAFLRFDVR